MIIEKVGPSIYETHAIPFIYLKREWAEYQLNILQNDVDSFDVEFEIKEVTIVDKGPK